jgi:hypothetical protein
MLSRVEQTPCYIGVQSFCDSVDGGCGENRADWHHGPRSEYTGELNIVPDGKVVS